MRIAFYAGRAVTHLLRTIISSLVTSVDCVLCGSTAGCISLCPECRRLLDEEAVRAIQETRRCSQCGRPLLSEHGVCTTCREKPLFESVDGVFPLFTYVLSKKKLLYSWKIARQHNLTEVFARYLAQALKERFPDAAIVPVPPRPGKLRKNGWDQIEDLSRYLEYMYGIKVLRVLRRTEAVQQKKLTKEERAEHSKRSYVWNERAVKALHGEMPEHVVLLDDVITTGSTVTACTMILKDAGSFVKAGGKAEKSVQKVSAASLFIVPG